jgi:uncharacterized protein (TIGR02266 family)
MATGMHSGRYGVLVRLFDLINETSEDQQLTLLKHLHKGNYTSPLFKLIIELSRDEQSALLVKLKEMFSEEVPERTIDLDEREFPRQPCRLSVDYATQDNTGIEHILDISAGGVFIETNASMALGQELTLKFSLPDSPDTFEVSGKIIWSGPKGIGVKFKDIKQREIIRIKTYLENKEKP